MDPENETTDYVDPDTTFPILTKEEMTFLLDLRRRHAKALKSRRGVYKVDIGYRWKGDTLTNEIALRTHVKEKLPLPQLESKLWRTLLQP